ncbi:sensor histidine kinase [Undibacterium sp. Ren11W]|uniref:sensor histidine kinase n=1 Tax=Undibacterium sp. Ren11W TaxID=3413045 RepID=UPI003BF26007
MHSLMRPTLVRRVFFSLLIACSVIWTIMMALDLSINLGDAKTSEELSELSAYLVDGLAQIENEAAAGSFILGAVGEAKRPAYNWRNFGFVKYQLSDRNGRLLLSNLAVSEPALAGKVGQVSAIERNGRRFLLLRSETPRWSLNIALPLHTFWGILRDDWLELTLNILIAFPFIFIPVWIAISRGLRPLNLLSERIAARGSGDLSAVNVDPRYAEMKPLVTALDSLLAQLRHTIHREHAFVQDAAHELRTPMAVISAQAHVLSMASNAQERGEAERHMDLAIARAAHLIQQLLDLAQLDARPAQPSEALDVAQLVRQELALRAPTAIARKLDLSLEAPDSLCLALEPNAFRSVLQNLVNNALHYVQQGGRIVVELKEQDDVVSLSVADNGPGIPEYQRELVFERFHRGTGNTAPGSGLGLAIARQAAAALNGTIHIATGLDNSGCQFVLRLPNSKSIRLKFD